jgi:predicted ATPase
VETISHLRTGLALLHTLLETRERVQREVDMLIALGASLIAAKGQAAPEVGETYTRARQLCEHLKEPHHLFPILRGLWIYYYARAELQMAHALGERLLTLAQQSQDSAMLVAAHRALGATLWNLGEIALGHTHLTQGMALYNPQQHRAAAFLYGEDAGVMCHSSATLTLWLLGYPDQGRVQSHEALTLAQQSAHPFSLGRALSFAAVFHQLRREGHIAQEYAEASISVATEQGFPYWRARGAVLRGWALASQGQAQEGIEQIHQGLTALRATGAEVTRPHFLALLAEAYGTTAQPEAGLTALAEALTFTETTGGRWYEPELYRLRGALLLQQNADNHLRVEACFHKALDIARSQEAKSLELRAATSLARLWQQQGKRQEAYDLLAPVYNWFTEGFDTLDLKDAKALLNELA